MADILVDIVKFLREGRDLVMASIVAQAGSTPRAAGAKMLLALEGGAAALVSGTIGGGLVEGESMAAAARVFASRRPEMLDFDLTGELAAGADMICGGRLRIFVEPLTPADLPVFEQLEAARRERRRAATVTRLDGGGRLVEFKGSGPAVKERDGVSVFVEPWPVPPRMILAGGGHVARATADVAAQAGFEVIVLDDRPEFADPRRFPAAALVRVTPGFADCFAGLVVDQETYVAVITRGHVHDALVLEQALELDAGYIGMIGSRRKREAVYEALRAQGRTGLERVHCPIGLDIGAETPGEIAVSIVAECLAVKAGRR